MFRNLVPRSKGKVTPVSSPVLPGGYPHSPRRGGSSFVWRLSKLVMVLVVIIVVLAIRLLLTPRCTPPAVLPASLQRDNIDYRKWTTSAPILESQRQAEMFSQTPIPSPPLNSPSPPPTPPPSPPSPPSQSASVQSTTAPKSDDTFYGDQLPEHADRLPGLRIHSRTYTADELMHAYKNTTFLYSFVNGSEVNHFFRKSSLKACWPKMRHAEMEFYRQRANRTTDAHPELDAPEADEEDVPQSSCYPPFIKGPNEGSLSLRSLSDEVTRLAVNGEDNRDRETDELRHSMRSIEQHIRWHRGRVVIVSPGHHPQWVDAATNFLSSSCGGAPAAAARDNGAHVRVTTVHQDAVMPYGLKLTTNSHVIEQHLWRVKNITSVHVYFNDDYFVNRDVAITDFFNEYGGTIVRTEASRLKLGEVADGTASWAKGVKHVQLFNIVALEERSEDYLPADLADMWRNQQRLTNASSRVPIPPLADAVDVARTYKPEPLPTKKRTSRRRRHYTTHAPFTYCTNMFAYLETRYEREFALSGLLHRGRKAADLFVPFLYNGFIMARPWQASPKFLPYLLDLNASRHESRQPQPVDIYLNNDDGCGPATEYTGEASQCVYAKFLDDAVENQIAMDRVRDKNPLFFNINAGFKNEEASQQLVKFLSTKFTKPVYVERGASEELRALYDALMGLPVVVLTSFSEGVCPAVRSLQLWLPDHRGSVVGIVQRFGDDSDPALSELRQTLRHRVRSAMPAVACALDSARVRVVEWERERTVADVLSAASPSAAVPLPASCGVGGSADGSVSVRAIVVDARTASGGVELDARWLRGAVTVPGQTVALEDFDVVRMADGAAVLVLSRAAADAKGVHWIDGASESDLLLTFPLPYPPYEDMLAPVKWAHTD